LAERLLLLESVFPESVFPFTIEPRATGGWPLTTDGADTRLVTFCRALFDRVAAVGVWPDRTAGVGDLPDCRFAGVGPFALEAVFFSAFFGWGLALVLPLTSSRNRRRNLPLPNNLSWYSAAALPHKTVVVRIATIKT
jgi:hypothetical protein